MGRRRYAKSGLGFLLAFALATATPAAASVAAQQETAQGSVAQQDNAQRSAAAAQTSATASSGLTGESATAVSGAADSQSAEPEPNVAIEPNVTVQPEPTIAQPESPLETGRGIDSATSATVPATAPTETPTQTTLPTSGTAETTEPAPEQQNIDVEPAAKALNDTSASTEDRTKNPNGNESPAITVRVYQLVTGLDGSIDRTAPKPGWDFSLTGGSIKNASDNATTDMNGLAVFSGNTPGESPGANLEIQETDESLSGYRLVQQDGKNAICTTDDVDTVKVTNVHPSGFQIKAYAGDTVTCTVYSRPLAAELTLINKVKNGLDGTASASDWSLTATPEMTSSDTITATGSTGGERFTVAHGVYELNQSAGPANYTWQSLKCSTGGGPAVDVEDFTIDLDVGAETTCAFINAYQGIDIDKRAWNTPGFSPGAVYPDVPEFDDGALVPFGTTVTWTYTVTNTGATAINGIAVDDDQLAAVVCCPDSRLRPGESMVCTASGQLTS